MQLYFRQYWQDFRLAYKKPNKPITLPGNVADRLWQPDTYFEDSKKGVLHQLTTLNKAMVVSPDGGVYVSTRYRTDLRKRFFSLFGSNSYKAVVHVYPFDCVQNLFVI